METGFKDSDSQSKKVKSGEEDNQDYLKKNSNDSNKIRNWKNPAGIDVKIEKAASKNVRGKSKPRSNFRPAVKKKEQKSQASKQKAVKAFRDTSPYI